jgi:WD40 repeat protein
MKRSVFTAIILTVFLLSACQPAAPTATPALEPTAEPAAATTASPTAEPLPTAALPTATEQAQETGPAETDTPEPAPLPAAEALVLTADTIRQASLAHRIGAGALVTAALSPDGTQAAVLTTTTLTAWDVADGEQLWQAPLDRVYNRAVFSADGSHVITSTRGGTVSYWESATGEKGEQTLPVIPNTRMVSLSANGALLAALDIFDQTFVWDTATGEQVQTNNGLAYPFGAMQVAVSGDGKTFLNSGIDSKENYQIRVWDVERGRFLVNLQGLPDEVADIEFSPDGQFAAAVDTRVSGGLRGMQYLYVWRVSDGALLDTVDLSLDASTYGFLSGSPTVLAGTASGRVIVVEVRIGDRYSYGYIKDQVPAHDAPVVSLSSSADGLRYVSAAADGSVKVWDVETGEMLFETLIEGLSLSNIHDEWVYTNLEVTNLQHESGFSASPVDEAIARTAADLRAIELVDLANGEVTASLKIETGAWFNSPVFSPDGQSVAAVLDGKRIVIWDVETGSEEVRISTQHIKPITQLMFSPDGVSIASMSDGELFVWNLDPVSQKHALTTYRSFDWSADGRYILTDAQGLGINLLDGPSGRKITYIETGFANGLSFSPDSQFAAVAGYRSPARYQQDNLVYFIDLATQTRIRTLGISGFPTEAALVEYTPDGGAIVSLDLYGNVYVWSTSTGALLKHFEEQVPMPAQIGFSADGKSLLIMGSDNSLQVFQALQ